MIGAVQQDCVRPAHKVQRHPGGGVDLAASLVMLRPDQSRFREDADVFALDGDNVELGEQVGTPLRRVKAHERFHHRPVLRI